MLKAARQNLYKAMQARHPKTGKPIRILQADTAVWRNQKTLAWLTEVPAADPTRWNRYEIGTTSIQSYKTLKAAGIHVNILVCLDPVEISEPWLRTDEPRDLAILAVPKRLIDHVGIEDLMSLRHENMICLEELKELYPFTGDVWDGTTDDAKVLISLMLHMARTFPVATPPSGGRPLYSLECLPELVAPRPLWLIQQYYVPEKGRREREIKACLEKNLECDVIDKIVLLNEKSYEDKLPKSSKIEEHVLGHRMTYKDVVQWIYNSVPEDVLVAFANSDIYLDDSWRALWSIKIDDLFLSLLRWDVPDSGEPKIFGPRPDSQDTWVLSARAVKSKSWNWDALDFPFGKMGCDNAINVEMVRQKLLITNPAFTFKTYHLHTSAVRTYDPQDIVDKPVLFYIHPSGLHDMNPVKAFPQDKIIRTVEAAAYDRPFQGPNTFLNYETYCSMIGRATNKMIHIKPDSVNRIAVRKMPIYKYENAFQTRQGLAYTYDSILVGMNKDSIDAWSKSQISIAAASVRADRSFVAPLPDTIAASPAQYVLYYLGKIFAMRSVFTDDKKGEFWCSKKSEFVEVLKLFKWPNRIVPVVSREESHQIWAKETIVWDRIDDSLITPVETEALREMLGERWHPTVSSDKVVVFVEGGWLTSDAIKAIEEGIGSDSVQLVYPTTSPHKILEALQGAAGAIVQKGSLHPWIWMLPAGATVWELQSEMEPSMDLLNLACGAGLSHRFVFLAKGSPTEAARKAVVSRILEDRAALTTARATPVKTSIPEIWIPDQGATGFFGHAGDSFREMVDLWAERGFCSVKRQKNLSHVWLGGVNRTLLYDRPTMDWLKASPASELTWNHALFGNPAPLKGEKAWTFWPRRPRIVEQLVREGIAATGFPERKQGLVFYGRSENNVQKGNRTKAEWSSACSEFVHLEGEKPYPYSHEQYLRRLADARFGLCLAGFGRKCHREIECMAMGCVPVVAPEVDMDNYADPPEEGVHYFRVQTPEDAKKLVDGLGEERWRAMSAACREWWTRNASVEGSWALTQQLTTA